MLEDEVEQLLRKLRETRQRWIDSLACGNVSPANVPDGYMQYTGRIQGIDEAITLTKDVFSAWVLPDPTPKQAPKIIDY